MRRQLGFGFSLAAALCAGCASSGSRPPAPAAAAPILDARATDALQAMCDHIAAQQQFSCRARVRYDDYNVGDELVELAKDVRVEVARPDRAHGVVSGDVENREYWYDGARVVILDRDHNLYAEIEAGGTIDEMLDRIAREHGLVLPLAELISSKPCEWLLGNVTAGYYLGEHRVDDELCTHLAFEQANLNWEIWLSTGTAPTPRRIVINYKSEPGRPHYAATFESWTAGAGAPADVNLPEGAQQVAWIEPRSVVGTGTPREE